MERRMSKFIVYHGTDTLFDQIELNKSKDKRDFGKGFYTTTIEAQAESWARNMRIRRQSKDAWVNVYELTITDDLEVKEFDGLTVEWLNFVKDNRSLGGAQHQYDIVMGPVADDNTLVTVMRYIEGVYTAEEAIKRLAFFKTNDQVAFHTEKALECLRLIRRYPVEH